MPNIGFTLALKSNITIIISELVQHGSARHGLITVLSQTIVQSLVNKLLVGQITDI